MVLKWLSENELSLEVCGQLCDLVTVNGVIAFFMALLSFRGISTPSLPAQGKQRRSSYFNIPRGNSHSLTESLRATLQRALSCNQSELAEFTGYE